MCNQLIENEFLQLFVCLNLRTRSFDGSSGRLRRPGKLDWARLDGRTRASNIEFGREQASQSVGLAELGEKAAKHKAGQQLIRRPSERARGQASVKISALFSFFFFFFSLSIVFRAHSRAASGGPSSARNTAN